MGKIQIHPEELLIEATPSEKDRDGSWVPSLLVFRRQVNDFP
jgi:hypothetical protein